MISVVEITKLAEKQLRKVPRNILDNLMIWVAAVEHDGSRRSARFPVTTMSRSRATGPVSGRFD